MNKSNRSYIKPLDIENGCIDLFHGSGGKASAQLINEIFINEFSNEVLNQLNDQAVISLPKGRMVMTTDSFVITPLFFSGGDIGSLSVHGTVNDIAVSGAKPLYLSAGFVIEEGFPLSKLKQIVESMAKAAKESGVSIVTGDTKVVDKGKMDGLFINTTGIGIISNDKINISANNARPGDSIIVSGYIGDHAATIMSQRNNLEFGTTLLSDSASLYTLVASMLEVAPDIHCLRDATRGGVAAVLNELAISSNVGISIKTSSLPVRQEVEAICEILGIDPLYLANEGKIVAICPKDKEEILLKTMRSHENGKDAAVIGNVIADSDNFVYCDTLLGGEKILQYMSGDPLPRIC